MIFVKPYFEVKKKARNLNHILIRGLRQPIQQIDQARTKSL